MKRLVCLGALVLLAACVETATPPLDTPVIEVYGGGGFAGSSRTLIYANDTLSSEQTNPNGKTVRNSVQGHPGAYQAALAIIRAEGPHLRRAMKGKADSYDCLDYGTDLVSVTPPATGFDKVSANCPEQAMLAFQRKILDAATGASGP